MVAGPACTLVGPSHRNRGVGSELWRVLHPLARESGLPGIRAMADVEDERSMNIAEAHGFSKGTIRRESVLDLTTVRGEFVEAAVGRATQEGVELAAFAPSSERGWEEFYESFLKLHQTSPDGAEGREPPTYESIRSGYAERWQVLLARRGIGHRRNDHGLSTR